jgi:hypothetical protein
MNPDLIYARTPEGERLARSPRQIGSYGHRATLLLVDGHISVGELQHRFGTTLPIEKVLEQLEHDGLVHVKAAEVSEDAPDEGSPGDLSTVEFDPLFDPAVERITAEHLTGQVEVAEKGERREPTLVRAHAALHLPEDEFLNSAARPAMPSVDVGDADMADVPMPASADRASAPALRGLGRKAWWLGLGILALGLVAGLTLWLARLRPQVETLATAALGVPVEVRSLGPALHNGPALTLKDVTIGLDPPLVLPRVDVMPDPRRGNVWSPSRVLIMNASLKPSELSALAGLLRGSAAVTELEFSELQLRLGALQVGALAGNLENTSEGGAVFKLANPAGGLNLEARPSGRSLAVYLTATPGTLPLLGRPQIGMVELRGLLDDAGLSGGELGMTGYGGKFEGNLTMTWGGPVSVDAKLRMAAVSMKQLSRSLFERGGFVDGQASGMLAVEARAARWEDLVRIDRLTASFMVERGAFKGFDLGAALRERSAHPRSGGETRFDSLRGRLEAGPREIRVWVDRLDAGALSASGLLTVAGFESLKGNLSAAVQVPGHGVQRYPAQLAGTVAMPSIQLVLPPGGEVAATSVPSNAQRGDEQQ